VERRLMPRGLAAVLGCLALGACVNPVSVRDVVVDEVKAATGRYLQVSSSTPGAGDTGVSPGAVIAVSFDRDVDPATLDGAVSFSPAADFTPAYDPATRTLSVTPAALEGGASYTLTVADTVKGANGDVLRSPWTLTFTTASVPMGSFTVSSTNADSQPGFTNTTAVTLSIKANTLAEKMCYSELSDLSDATWVALDVTKAYTLKGAANTALKVYLRFADRDVTNLSPIVTAAITYDTAPPSVSAGTLAYLNAATSASGATPGATASDSLSGIQKCLWTSAKASFSDASALNPGITSTAVDGMVTAVLTATDKAGNSASATLTLIKDTVAPNAPTVTVTTASPGTASNVAITLASGGGGSGTYRYKVTSSGSYTTTTSTTGTATVSEYGSSTIYANESDAAGNWSAAGSDTYFRYPTFLYPPHGSTGILVTPTLKYASRFPLAGTTFTVYIKKKALLSVYTELTSGSNSFTYHITTPLDSATQYYWYYETHSGRITETSPIYSFTTQ
jgi:hypothetical protein